MPKRRRHYRVTLADAYLAHDVALQSGGRPGVLNAGRIEAAVHRPYSGYHRPIASKAAALFESIANNHGFVDGNKRTAVLLTDLLLLLSGYDLAAHANEDINLAISDFAISVAKGELDLEEITAWFKQRIVRG